jgi:hypothetical protein
VIKFTAEIEGVEVFNRGFTRIEEEIDDLRSIWPGVSHEIYDIEDEQFESEGAAGASGRWAALSKAYAVYKAVQFPNQPILRATTSLFDSVTRPDAPDSIFRPEKGLLTIGTQREGAVHHQRGTSKMPARKIYSFNESQKRRIQKAIQAGLVQFVRRQGFQVIEQAA